MKHTYKRQKLNSEKAFPTGILQVNIGELDASGIPFYPFRANLTPIVLGNLE